jgi:hypothetical protein
MTGLAIQPPGMASSVATGGTSLTTGSASAHGEIEERRLDGHKIRSVLPKIFQHIKFLNGDEDLADDSAMARFFYGELRIPVHARRDWWDQNKETVRVSVNTRRANIQDSVKETIMCK